MKLTPHVKTILSYYSHESPAILNRLAQLFMHGSLAGTGKLVILPVDQGFEHGPYRSFGKNPPAFDPEYHFKLAIEAGCNAYAAPLGFLEAGATRFAGEIPLILKLNHSDSLSKIEPRSAITASVKDAIRLGCIGIGYTIYPGSNERNSIYENFREISAEAKAHGLLVFVWSYPRGKSLTKEGEQALDVIAYSAHIAAQLGAHVIKVKLPKNCLELPEAIKVYENYPIPTESLADRVKHIVQACFQGKRIVIFSGGEAKETKDILEETRAIANGGGHGSIVGRNAFQRPYEEAVVLLKQMMEIYRLTP